MKIIIKIRDWQNKSGYVSEEVYYVGWERKKVRDKKEIGKRLAAVTKPQEFLFLAEQKRYYLRIMFGLLILKSILKFMILKSEN